MACVKNEKGEYVCDITPCPFISECDPDTDEDYVQCPVEAARAWADDRAKIKEQAQKIQDLGDDLDNANELLTIAEEKVKEQAATIERPRAACKMVEAAQ